MVMEPEWISWGPDSPGYPQCPVEPGTDCEVRMRGGVEWRDCEPEEYSWQHSISGELLHDIIAYRVWPAKDDAVEEIRDQLGPKFKHLAPLVALEVIPALVEGLHAQVFAVHSLGDPEASHAALADNGQIHETVHALVRALPGRGAGPAKDDARALLAITAATGAIFERMAGGKIDWRNADDDLLQSADWLTAQEYARAAIDAYLERNR